MKPYILLLAGAALGLGILTAVRLTGNSEPEASSCCPSPHPTARQTGASRSLSGAGTEGASGVALSASQSATPQAQAPLSEPLKGVTDSYLKIHAALANDSIEALAANARTLAQAVRSDPGKTLPIKLAQQAETLAQAKDLASARQAFRPVSESLIQVTRANKLVPGTFVEVYCPMAKAAWLQSDKTIRNPYYGQSMLNCGGIRG